MDLSLFYAIHSLSGMSPVLDVIIVFFAKWYIYILVAVFLYEAWKDGKNWTKYFTAFAAGVFARVGLTELIRHYYHHDRPFVTLEITHLLTDNAYSFPSGHTIFIFALGAATLFFNKKLAWFIFASGILVGTARVAAGVHYPSDILGGIVLGLLVGSVVYLLGRKLLK